MNVNEYLELYYAELQQLSIRVPNPHNIQAESNEPDCEDCGTTPFDDVRSKLAGLRLLFGVDVADSIDRAVDVAYHNWATEKANAKQAAVEMTLWLDFLGYLNKQTAFPLKMWDDLNNNYWVCDHPSFGGFIPVNQNCPVCHKDKDNPNANYYPR